MIHYNNKTSWEVQWDNQHVQMVYTDLSKNTKKGYDVLLPTN